MSQTVLAIFFMFFINSGWSFVLLGTSAPPRYPSGHIAVKIVNDHTCANITLSAEELRDLTQEAVDDFWNTVHTSSLYLDVQGYVSSNGRDINDFLGETNDLLMKTNDFLMNTNDFLMKTNDFLSQTSDFLRKTNL